MRNSVVEEGGDARVLFWGIESFETISFAVIAIYHINILVPPLIFWFLCLFCRDYRGDLQNAAVPFLAGQSMLVFLWSYLNLAWCIMSWYSLLRRLDPCMIFCRKRHESPL